MSGWLDDVLGAYLDKVSEREFDSVFVALLRAAGYTDIHFLHGAYEFGKDFIAKKDGRQYAFQTKAGDLNLAAWRTVRAQVIEMLWNDIAHPNFDKDAERCAVVVTTGRYVGGAAADAQQFGLAMERRRRPARRLSRRRRSVEPVFVTWDRETLLTLLAFTPSISLSNWGEAPLFGLLGVLADVDRRVVSSRSIERASREWIGGDLNRAALAAAVVANRLTETQRPDLACGAACCLIRAAAVELHQESSTEAFAVLDAGRRLYDAHASSILDEIAPVANDTSGMFRLGNEVLSSVTYPVRCSIAIETLGMLGLLRLGEGNEGEAQRIANLLSDFVNAQPGAAHPISDRWCASLVPPSLLLRRLAPDALVPWLERVVIWICDHHYKAPGMAPVYATPDDEILYLLGGPLEHCDIHRRTQSYLATTVLDIASTLALDALFRDAVNDFLAVGIAFPVMEPLDEVGQFLFDGTGLLLEANVPYDEEHDFAESWRSAPHHARTPDTYSLQRAGRSWDLLAVSTVLRDRHFLPVMRDLAGLAP